MSDTIERYMFEDRENISHDWTTFDIDEAREYARNYNLRLIAMTYEYIDSEMIEDYTGTDKDEE